MSKNLGLFILSLISMSLMACGQGPVDDQERSSSVRNAGTGSTGGGGGSTPTTPSTSTGFVEKCSDGSSAVGYVYDGGLTGDFRARVVSFVSATLPASDLGQVSGVAGAKTGLDLRMRVKMTANGQLDGANSRVQFKIYDSFVGTTDKTTGLPIQPYDVNLRSLDIQSSQVNQQTKKIHVVFSDKYGTVTFDGSWDSFAMRGKVTYANTKHYSNGAPASGDLGGFAIPVCGVF